VQAEQLTGNGFPTGGDYPTLACSGVVALRPRVCWRAELCLAVTSAPGL